MARSARFLRHVVTDHYSVRRIFSADALARIERAIADAEQTHGGQIVFAVESALPLARVHRDVTPRQRALEAFGLLKVWDTEHNNGVLFYVSLAEHRIEIVADRGIAARVTSAEWDAICARMRECFAAGQWRTGSLDGIAAAHALLRQHFPADDDASRGELSDRPVLL